MKVLCCLVMFDLAKYKHLVNGYLLISMSFCYFMDKGVRIVNEGERFECFYCGESMEVKDMVRKIRHIGSNLEKKGNVWSNGKRGASVGVFKAKPVNRKPQS